MIEAKQLTKNYGTFTAVKQVSFSAKPGEVVGLLGPNGAGKSTIMRMLTGFTPPTSGKAFIAGFDVSIDPLDAREHVGYLPERVPLYPDMTVFEYISYWAQLRGLRDRRHRRQQVNAVIDRVQLGFKSKALIRSLSKGMRQRLGLAQAIVHNPDVIILDEPTIGIDPQQVIEVREMVRGLRDEHCVLFSTHILTEAEQVCDRLLIINQGQIIAEGTPNELRRRFQHGADLYLETADGVSAVLTTILQQYPGVEQVAVQGNGYQLRIGTVDRAPFIEHITQAGYIVIEVRPIAMTLEDIFLNLIGKPA